MSCTSASQQIEKKKNVFQVSLPYKKFPKGFSIDLNS